MHKNLQDLAQQNAQQHHLILLGRYTQKKGPTGHNHPQAGIM